MPAVKSVSLKALKEATERIRADAASQIIELTTVLVETVNDLEALKAQVEKLRAQVNEMRGVSDMPVQPGD